eukprot:Skav213005  [mRNA]  locus=scaffold561:11416:11948:+ [translate_table: standard]
MFLSRGARTWRSFPGDFDRHVKRDRGPVCCEAAEVNSEISPVKLDEVGVSEQFALLQEIAQKWAAELRLSCACGLLAVCASPAPLVTPQEEDAVAAKKKYRITQMFRCAAVRVRAAGWS